jgi:hypothetical protein
MAQYRCYLLDGSGKIVAFEEIETASTDEALELARRLLAQQHSHGFELWQGRECLHKESRVCS